MLKFIRNMSDKLGVGNSFALANVFAFAMSGNPLGLGIAIVTALLCWRAEAYAMRSIKAQGGYKKLEDKVFGYLQHKLLGQESHKQHLGLRINAVGVGLAALVTGGMSLFSAQLAQALFPVVAGSLFSIGNYLGSSEAVLRLQKGEVKASGVKRALTNPAVYYGFAYANLGLLAGGGLALFTAPFANIPAFVSTALSILSAGTSVAGLVTNRIKNPAPFMFVAHGSAFNILSGLFTLNPLAVLNNAFACHGEVKLGLILREDKPEVPKQPLENKPQRRQTRDAVSTQPQNAVKKESLPKAQVSPVFRQSVRGSWLDCYFEGVSHAACWPIRVADRYQHGGPKI